MILIRINTTNAAFKGAQKYHEIARILRGFAVRVLLHNELNCDINDINGNKVAKIREVRDAYVKEVAD